MVSLRLDTREYRNEVEMIKGQVLNGVWSTEGCHTCLVDTVPSYANTIVPTRVIKQQEESEKGDNQGIQAYIHSFVPCSDHYMANTLPTNDLHA